MRVFSIVIPHKDNVEGLDRLIKSIPDCPDVEIIVVDDHSTAENVKHLKEAYPDSRVRIKLLENKSDVYSAGKARNIALDHVSPDSEWLIFADSDDYFTSGWLTEIEKFRNHEADVIFFKPTSQNGVTKDADTRGQFAASLVDKFLKVGDRDSELNLRAKFLVPWSKMIRHDLIRRHELRFDEVYVSNDVMFSLKCGVFATSVYASDSEVYCATRNPNSLITKRSENNYLTRFKVYVESQKFLREHLSTQEFQQCCESVLRWYKIGAENKLSASYFVTLTKNTIRYRLPLKLKSFKNKQNE